MVMDEVYLSPCCSINKDFIYRMAS